MVNEIEIDSKLIGLNHKPYIIAELSANPNGSLERALKTIEEAHSCGADAIKIQTYTADSMTIDCVEMILWLKGDCGMVTNCMIYTTGLTLPTNGINQCLILLESLGLQCFQRPSMKMQWIYWRTSMLRLTK